MNIVFFDIDGTLAIGKEIPESAQKALHELRMNGTLVFICTGRGYGYAYRNFYKYANGFVCSNGRLARMGCCERLFDAPLPAEQVKDIIAKLDSAGAGYAFFDEEKGYYGGDPEGYEMMAAVFRPGVMEKGVNPETLRAYNFDVWFRSIEQRKQIEALLEGTCVLNPHGPHPTADVTILGVDKGTAIRAVAEKLNVPIEDTYAFGDGVNDLFMMKAAGHSVAMGNAVDKVKEKAEFVTTDILDNGVWNGLAHYGLIKGEL